MINVLSQIMKPASKSRPRQPAMSAVLTLIMLLIFGCPASSALAQDREPDVARGAQAWAQHCMRCHNPRSPGELTDPEWEISMLHMRIIANLPGDMARDILKFLQESDGKTFGTARRIAPGRRITSEIDADQAKALHNELGCVACHGIGDSTLVGPGYKEIAERYDMDEESVAKLIRAVRTGSSGAWGPHHMPPNPRISEEEVEFLLSWILSLE